MSISETFISFLYLGDFFFLLGFGLRTTLIKEVDKPLINEVQCTSLIIRTRQERNKERKQERTLQIKQEGMQGRKKAVQKQKQKAKPQAKGKKEGDASVTFSRVQHL